MDNSKSTATQFGTFHSLKSHNSPTVMPEQISFMPFHTGKWEKLSTIT